MEGPVVAGPCLTKGASMSIRLELVSDCKAKRFTEEPQASVSLPADLPTDLPAALSTGFVPQPRPARGVLSITRQWFGSARRVMVNEQGAVTAEYAIVIMAAVAFAGLLVAIMRSDAVRAMLVQLVENALGTGG